MIQANELRVGNIVSHKGIIDNVTGVWGNRVKFGWQSVWSTTIDDIDPIPLTPEILEAAGFKETRRSSGIFDKGVMRIAVNISAAFIIQDEQVISLRILIDYLHQLQNLHFSLSGEELSINPELINPVFKNVTIEYIPRNENH